MNFDMEVSHLNIICGNQEVEKIIATYLPMTAKNGELTNMISNSKIKNLFKNDDALFAISYPKTDIRWIVLEYKNTLENILDIKGFYPASVSGQKSQIQISRIEEDADFGFEANIHAEIGVADINFFDPFYFFNKHHYILGHPIDFYFSGLAYTLKKSIPKEFVANNETHILDGAAILMSVNDLCDYQYMMTIVELDEIHIDNELIYKIKGLVINSIDTETIFNINLYVSSKNILTENYIPQIGDSVEGVFWLQGYHKAFGE